MTGRAKVVPMNRGYEPSRVVHLRNLPEDIDMDDVMELGRPFGPVISALRIKETQAFLYMQELKDAEDLVNEYRQHPPKIGWRTVFVQFSQYTRLDVGPRKPDTQGHARQHNTGADRHVRDRSRERSSRRSPSPDSPPSPPLPDITVPFYMLPRSDDPEITFPTTSRPQLVSYPHLTNTARLPPISYPVPQTHDSPAVPLISYPTSAQKLDDSLAPPDMMIAPGNDAGLANVEQYQQMPYQPPPSHLSYDERSCQPEYYNNSTAHNIANHHHHHHHHHRQQQSVAGQSEPESNLNYLHSVIESIAKDIQTCRHKATSDLLGYVTDEDRALVETLRHDFGERSLPVIVSTIVALRQLDDSSVISSLVCLDTASVNAVAQQHSFAGEDDFTALFLRIAQTIHADSGQTHTAAKRRRYDDSDGVNNFASSLSSSSAAAHLQQNQLWNNDTDYHRHQLR